MKSYFSKLTNAFNQIDLIQVDNMIEALLLIVRSKGIVFAAGNGGSCSTAQHFLLDIGVGSHIRGGGVRTLCLSSDPSELSAISNDLGYEDFLTQRFLQFTPSRDDLLVVFSASGRSPNILSLIHTAKSKGVSICAFTGFDGGEARDLADIKLHVPTDRGEYGIVEDLHLSISHHITEQFRQRQSKIERKSINNEKHKA